MANKMLIDASHPEETRVVVLRGNRVEEFDFESASKKQLRGNIYLAKVTRVEPSLQAAFVDYGGNRHGFLAFSEIHPDYYQIPVADRQALLEDEARAQEQDAEDEGRPNNNQRRTRRNRRDRSPRPDKRRPRDEENVSGLSGDSEPSLAAETGDQGYSSSNDASGDDAHSRHYDDGRSTEHADTSQEHAVTSHENEHRAHPANAHDDASPASGDSPALARSATGLADDRVHSDVQPDVQEERWAPREVPAQGSPAPVDADAPSATREQNTDTPAAPALDAGETPLESRGDQPGGDEADDGDDDGEETEEEQVEQLGGDAMEEMPVRAPRMRRQYKIQEVIKRRQVLLVQVVKEERGNKGAALTTYLSLAGRYSVLMPNTARGGGISRKITDTGDRKRLKEIAGELEVPDGMGVILRTAGASRTPQEVKRDFEYLLRMWETVREVTLKSTAPTLVYEEGSLIKRSIRDLFNKDVEEIVVAGEAGHKEARDFMRLLMPSHVKNVHAWDEQQPVFAKYGVEAQLDAMYSNHVTLKSGGYIVINQTEALVAIDVNSGRSTREHNIEDTALRTNLEAADEVARQLRLRDLAGLIVVDFIDMEEHRNNRSVERRMKDALKNDRARIQVGHISHFGLLEMSRQRIRTGVLEGSTIPCPHCTGSGIVRSTASIALHVLRVVEDALIKSATHNIIVRTRTEVALYILNQKRSHLRDIEKNFGVTVIVAADDTLTGAVYHAIERGELASPPVDFTRSALVRIDSITPDHVSEDEEEDEGEDEAANGDTAENVETEDAAAEGATDENDDPRRKRRRRRRRGRGDREPGAFQPSDAPQPPDAALAVMAQIHGDLPATLAEATLSDGDSDETEAAEFPVDEAVSGDDAESRRRRRPRRGGRSRGRDGKRFEPEFSSEAPAQAAAAETAEAPPVERTFEPVSASQPEPFGTTPSFAPPLEHVAAIYHPPAPQAVEAHAEPAPPKTPEPPPAYVAPLPEAPVDPDKPKKAGWWQKARQSFGN